MSTKYASCTSSRLYFPRPLRSYQLWRIAILNHHFSNAERLSTLRGLNLCLGCFLTAFEVCQSSTLTFVPLALVSLSVFTSSQTWVAVVLGIGLILGVMVLAKTVATKISFSPCPQNFQIFYNLFLCPAKPLFMVTGHRVATNYGL